MNHQIVEAKCDNCGWIGEEEFTIYDNQKPYKVGDEVGDCPDFCTKGKMKVITASSLFPGAGRIDKQ